MELNPKRIIESTRFAQIETAGLYGGYITGLTFSAQGGGVYNGTKLIEKAGGAESVTLEVKGTSDGIGNGEIFYIDFAGASYTGNQPKTGVPQDFYASEGTGYLSRTTYTVNSESGKGTGLQIQLIVGKGGGIRGIASIVSYGENYDIEIDNRVPITGGPGTGGFVVIKSTIDIPGTEIVYQTYAIRDITTIPDNDIERTEEDEKYRKNYQVGQQITIDPEQWGEVTSQLPVTFERLDYVENVDVVSPGVSLARSSNGGGALYNSITEAQYNMNDYSSPANTEWNSYYIDSAQGMYGFKDLSNVSTRKYGTFYDALWQSVGSYVLQTELVMHDKTTNLYWMFQFHTWTQGGKGGGFSYTRTLITDNKYAETTFTKKDYGTEVDTFSQYLSLKRGNNQGIYNPNEMNSYSNYGGVTHLWMSEPYDWYYTQAKLNISFDFTLLNRDINLSNHFIILRGHWIGYPNGLLKNDESNGYSISQKTDDTWTITFTNLNLSIPGYNVRNLDGLDDKQQQQILKQSLENEIFLFGHLWGLENEPDSGSLSIQMRDFSQDYTYYSSNYGQGNVVFSYSNVTISFDPVLYYKENLYNTFNPKDIDIKYLRDNLTKETINSMPWGNWGDYQMVPWQIIHNGTPPDMIDKEMIMLDVQDEKFYRIKFTQWTQNNAGGGFSYIKSEVTAQGNKNIVATVTDIAYNLVNSFTEPLSNQFSLSILFDKYTKMHFVRVTDEDGTVMDHDFDGNDYIPTPIPEESTFTGYEIEDVGNGVTRVKFEWTNDISSTDKLDVGVNTSIFTIQDKYIENGKLVVELVNDKTFYWYFGGDPNNSYRVNGGPGNSWNGLGYLFFNNIAFGDEEGGTTFDVSKELIGVVDGWRIDMTNLTSPGNYATYEITRRLDLGPNYQFFYMTPISGSGFFDLQNNHFWSMRFYPSGSLSALPSFNEFNFNVYAYDKLGKIIKDTLPVYKKEAVIKGIDIKVSGYKVSDEIDEPYVMDESYHAVIYLPDELTSITTTDDEYFSFGKNNIITEIGFPFHLKGGGGDNLKDEDVEAGFSIAAKIHHTDLETIEEEYVRNNWIVDGDFNPKILDKSSAVTGVVKMGKDGNRYVYFPIDDFVYDGGSSLLIVYYVDGQTEKGGWNVAYRPAYKYKTEEYLGFNKENDWIGKTSPGGGKISLAFTTNDNR